MQDADKRLDALAYALGWVVVITVVWLTAAWGVYIARVAGAFSFVPREWLPSPEVHLIFIVVAKLMLVGLITAWIAVLLYRRRLRRG